MASSESIKKVIGLFGWVMFYKEIIRSILMGQWVIRLGLVWWYNVFRCHYAGDKVMQIGLDLGNRSVMIISDGLWGYLKTVLCLMATGK